MTEAVDFPDPPLGDATATMGISQLRFVRKPDLALNRMDEKSGLRRIPDFSVNPVSKTHPMIARTRVLLDYPISCLTGWVW